MSAAAPGSRRGFRSAIWFPPSRPISSATSNCMTSRCKPSSTVFASPTSARSVPRSASSYCSIAPPPPNTWGQSWSSTERATSCSTRARRPRRGTTTPSATSSRRISAMPASASISASWDSTAPANMSSASAGAWPTPTEASPGSWSGRCASPISTRCSGNSTSETTHRSCWCAATAPCWRGCHPFRPASAATWRAPTCSGILAPPRRAALSSRWQGRTASTGFSPTARSATCR